MNRRPRAVENPMIEKVLNIIADISERPVAELRPDASLMVDLQLDSPKALELLMALEDDLGFEIDDEEAAGLETVQDILDLVALKLN